MSTFYLQLESDDGALLLGGADGLLLLNDYGLLDGVTAAAPCPDYLVDQLYDLYGCPLVIGPAGVTAAPGPPLGVVAFVPAVVLTGSGSNAQSVEGSTLQEG